jgi:uncharacterized repeat protein (TIGR03803 family)
MRTVRNVGFLIAALAVVLVASPGAHAAAGFTTLHEFTGNASPPTDGKFPYAGLLEATAGNFFGTTQSGGANGGGTIFHMKTDGTVTVLRDLPAVAQDAKAPLAALVQDTYGVLYGTTSFGGTHTANGGGGTIFYMTVDTSGVTPTVTDYKVLYSFPAPTNPGEAGPSAPLLYDAATDSFYGTSEFRSGSNMGNVFRMAVTARDDTTHVPTTVSVTQIHIFAGGLTDGAYPVAPLIADASGNIYGTTYAGGASGLGTIFRVVDPAGAKTFELLHSFSGSNTPPTDGSQPYAALLQSAPGGFYGTTSAGGANGLGTTFYMQDSAPWTVTTLFDLPAAAKSPYAPLIRDTDGMFYGTTGLGGSSAGGSVFYMTVDSSNPPILTGAATVHSFPAPANPGEYGPTAPILKGSDGNYYGTTFFTGTGGTYDFGTVFAFTQLTQTITFAAIPNHLFPGGPLTLSATASSGLPVTFSAGPAGVCSVSGTTLTLVGIGTCTVTASQIGNDAYKPAPDVSRSFGIGAGPGVDLIVTAVSNPPAYAAPGNNFSITDTTQNQGMLPAYAPITGYYLSLDSNITKTLGDILLQNGLRPMSTLNAGASSTGTVVKVYVPTNTPLNTYYLKACADYNNHVAESIENNNCLASGTQIGVTKPDLVVTDVSGTPTNAAAGSRFSFQNTVTNQGNVPAGAFVTSYYLSKGGVNLPLGGRSLSSLAALTPSTVTASVVVPGTAKGIYTLRVCADTSNSVSETIETNNCTNSANISIP